VIEISNKKETVHNMVLENRKKLSLTGINDVNSFDNTQITAFTEAGYLTIKGSSLHISKFNTSNGELNITGKIDELAYSNKQKSHLNFMEKIFK